MTRSSAEGAVGTRRLLRDLLAFGRAQHQHPSAKERLEAQLGQEFTHRLIDSLRTAPRAAQPDHFRDTG